MMQITTLQIFRWAPNQIENNCDLTVAEVHHKISNVLCFWFVFHRVSFAKDVDNWTEQWQAGAGLTAIVRGSLLK